MKMEWKKPELEVLDVIETMLGVNGDRLDSAFPGGGANRPILPIS